MKNLVKKLLLPLTFSTIFAFNSKAQDFLPGKFRNYQLNSKDTLLKENSYSHTLKSFIKNIYYDLDKDSIVDVVEVFLINYKNGELSKNPVFYLLDFNNPEPTLLLDFKMDGLNGNEIFHKKFEKKEFDKDSFNL